MKINILDNNEYDTTTLYNNWTTNHDWYRSVDTFQDNFPDHFQFTYWKRHNNDVSLFITKGVYSVDLIESKVKIAIPSDLRVFHSPIYDFIEKNIHKFDRVITYDERLISLFPDKCFPAAAMKPWIWPKQSQQVYDKIKLCSFITSRKGFIPGHQFRIKVLDQIKNRYDNIDCFGEGHNPLPEEEGKLFGLQDYAFSISMENHQSMYYFSEKLLDVILTGCIPIYWGCKSIGNYFNTKGFILFNHEEELYEILENLTFDMYKEKLEYVKENFELCQKKYIDNFHYFVQEGTEWL